MDCWKRCRRCGKVKSVADFYEHSQTKQLMAKCKTCHLQITRTYSNRLRENDDPRLKAWKRTSHLRAHGLSGQEYDRLLKRQGGRCAICRTDEADSKRRHPLYVDHDHASGIVRGLLCNHCNTGLGKFRDRVDLLGAAIAYLDGPRVEAVAK